jgi:transposase
VARIEPLLPLATGYRGRPWQTVWKRQHRFATHGTWDKVLTVWQAQADAEGRIDRRLSVDSSIARVHQHGAAAAKEWPGLGTRYGKHALVHRGGIVLASSLLWLP